MRANYWACALWPQKPTHPRASAPQQEKPPQWEARVPQTESSPSSVAQSCPTLWIPWTAAHQASLPITNSQSLFKPMSIESVMPSTHLILCRPLLLPPSIFPSIRAFSNSQFFASGGESTGVSASATFLPMNTQDLSPSGWTGWISLQSKGLSKSPLQHHSSKVSILGGSAFFRVLYILYLYIMNIFID